MVGGSGDLLHASKEVNTDVFSVVVCQERDGPSEGSRLLVVRAEPFGVVEAAPGLGSGAEDAVGSAGGGKGHHLGAFGRTRGGNEEGGVGGAFVRRGAAEKKGGGAVAEIAMQAERQFIRVRVIC